LNCSGERKKAILYLSKAQQRGKGMLQNEAEKLEKPEAGKPETFIGTEKGSRKMSGQGRRFQPAQRDRNDICRWGGGEDNEQH